MARIAGKFPGIIRLVTAIIALGGLAGCGDLSDAGVGGGASPGLAITAPTLATVNENGSSEPLTVALQTAPNGDVVIGVSSSKETEAAVNRSKLTFTAENWSLPQALTVTGVQDHRPDGNQEVEILFQIDAAQTLDNTGYAALAAGPANKVKVTVLDIDAVGVKLTPKEVAVAEGGANQSGTFEMTLATIPDADVAFVVSSDHRGIATVTPERLVFSPGTWATPQQVTVSGVDNQIADGPKATRVTLTVDPATLDASGYKNIAPSGVQVDVADDDIVNFTVTPRELTVRDTGPDFSAGFEVWLNTQPNGTVAIDVASSVPDQAVVDKALLTFSPSNFATKQMVTVTAVVDSVVDGHQIVDVNVKPNANGTDSTGYATLGGKNVAVAVLDGDIRGLRVSPRDLLINEGGTDAFTAMLRTRPNGTVAVNIASSAPAKLLVNGSGSTTLTFNAQNWNTAQAVTVAGVSGSLQQGSETIPVNISVVANGTSDTTGYVGLRSDVSVGVIDVP